MELPTYITKKRFHITSSARATKPETKNAARRPRAGVGYASDAIGSIPEGTTGVAPAAAHASPAIVRFVAPQATSVIRMPGRGRSANGRTSAPAAAPIVLTA